MSRCGSKALFYHPVLSLQVLLRQGAFLEGTEKTAALQPITIQPPSAHCTMCHAAVTNAQPPTQNGSPHVVVLMWCWTVVPMNKNIRPLSTIALLSRSSASLISVTDDTAKTTSTDIDTPLHRAFYYPDTRRDVHRVCGRSNLNGHDAHT